MSVVILTGLLSACATGPGHAPASSPGPIYHCGQLTVSVSETGDTGLLGVEYLGKRLLLKPARSASGALYVAPGDDSTRFWSKGERATLTIRGETYPECLIPGAIEMPFIARGNEPFWHAEISPGQLRLQRPFEQDGAQTFELETVTANRHGRIYAAAAGETEIRVTIARQLCQDTMADSQYPAQVRLTLNGETLNGCGGDPERLLRGAEWQVADLAGAGMIERSRVSVRFGADGQLSGQASCNRYSGRYQLSGEGLSIGPLVTTRMACAPALMNQEQRFLELLAAVHKARIDRLGRLVLTTPAGEAITAVQSTGQETP